MMTYDVVIIGGGAAGLAAASTFKHTNLKVVLIERDEVLGGILNQCIHNGFGLHVFHEMLTGPEFAQRFIDEIKTMDMETKLHTTVLDIKKDTNYIIQCASHIDGIYEIESKSIIISSGCYERSRGAISIPGTRPNGIMTAGTAQKYLNIDGYLVGKKVFILGSGDIGLIMARRMTLEGAKVLGVAELMPYANGLNRNIAQCLDDFNIPLYLSHTIVDIKGEKNLESITIQKLDESFEPIAKTKKTFDVDTLLLSVGLIPDIKVLNHIDIKKNLMTKSILVDQNYESSSSGIFACGNALHVHDLVDDVVIEAKRTGYAVEKYLNKMNQTNKYHDIKHHPMIRYTIPNQINEKQLIEDDIVLLFRTKRKYEAVIFIVKQQDKEIYRKKHLFVVPAEMNKIKLKIKDIDLHHHIMIDIEEVK